MAQSAKLISHGSLVLHDKSSKITDDNRTPCSFWDNLSRQWLTRRTLQEFDRRTAWSTTLVPPRRTGKESIDLAKLKRFARHGGPSLSDIRGYVDHAAPTSSNLTMDSSQSGPRKRVKTERELGTPSSTRKTSAYDPAFEQHLIDYGIYPEGYNDDEGSEEPANIEDIHRRLAQPRPSLSPSRFTRKKFLDFRQKNRKALTENTVMSKVFPIIAGTAEIPSQENLYFGNLKDLTDGSITKAKPDFYDGSHPTELNAQIRKQLSEYIEPSTKKTVPLLPNFFAEGKGPDGNATVCKRQAVYDEALGARGIHQLRSYVDPKTAYDNNAYTIASTYHGGTGTLTMYTTHAAPPKDPGSSAEYHMTQLKAFAMTSDPETFRQGATFLRNARDLTHDERKELIAAANAKALYAKSLCFSSSTQSSMSHSSNEPTHPESETSPDEFALDLVTLDRPNHGTPISTRTKSPPHVATNQRLKRDYRSNKSI